MNSLEIIKKEFEDLQMNPLCSIGVVVGLLEPNNYYKWKSSLMGAFDSPYKYGVFILKLIFPEDYPNTRPEVYFLTPIYHLNVNSSNTSEPLGSISSCFFDWWTPTSTVKELLSKLFLIFYLEKIDFSFDNAKTNEYLYNKSLYELKARYFTKKIYNLEEDQYEDFWNFSCTEEDLNSINLDDNSNYYENDDDIDENKTICITLILDGKKDTKFHCKINEITKNVVQRGLKQLGISEEIKKDDLLIFNLRRLNLDISIKDNGIIGDKTEFLMISDFDI